MCRRQCIFKLRSRRVAGDLSSELFWPRLAQLMHMRHACFFELWIKSQSFAKSTIRLVWWSNFNLIEKSLLIWPSSNQREIHRQWVELLQYVAVVQASFELLVVRNSNSWVRPPSWKYQHSCKELLTMLLAARLMCPLGMPQATDTKTTPACHAPWLPGFALIGLEIKVSNPWLVSLNDLNSKVSLVV
jgi:hypothetical protein